MKYSELIQFNPIDSVIQLKEADNAEKAKHLIETYVMSDKMADMINAKILSQLSIDEVIDNKGVFLVGNYGTGKSHLMSVISAVLNDKKNLPYLKNTKFAGYVASFAGHYEILRIELGSTQSMLRDIIVNELQKNLKSRGIDFIFPPADAITNNKEALAQMMSLFEAKYPDKGYLIVIDELLDYLKSRKQFDLISDLGFLRELGEFIKTSKFRLVCGIQEALFDNPSFTFVSSQLLKVKDRFEQAMISREDISFVVSERILKKTPAQKNIIKKHLLKFCSLYKNMAERLDEYVDLFPIHPSYIETFQRMYLAEKREVLKTISSLIKGLLNTEVPTNMPGIKSYDTYWTFIKENIAKKTEVTIAEVLDKSAILENIIQRSFPKSIYKPIAMQIIYALSVHRLTTNSLVSPNGLTAQNLKDELCLYIQTPEEDEDFLVTTISTIISDIVKTASGQFIDNNKENGQYYLNLAKNIDYDQKIIEKADTLDDSSLNNYFYTVLFEQLQWDKDQYVPTYRIYAYDSLNWEEKNINRRGYLFLGIPDDRPTAHPAQDFYVYFLPPFGSVKYDNLKKADEVFFKLVSDEAFKRTLQLYAGANEMANISTDGKTAYIEKSKFYKRELANWLDKNRVNCFNIEYKGETIKFLQATGGSRIVDKTFKEMIDLISSNMLNDYFTAKYPKYPKFQIQVTEKNWREVLMYGLNILCGKGQGNQSGMKLLDSFGLIKDGQIKPENSAYANYYIKLVDKLSGNQVINFDDLMESPKNKFPYDKYFNLDAPWIALILVSLVASGHLTILNGSGERIDASNLERAYNPALLADLYLFKNISKPKSSNIREIKKFFSILGVPEGNLVSNKWDDACKQLIQRTSNLCDEAAGYHNRLIQSDAMLWGERLIPENYSDKMTSDLKFIVDTYNNVNNRFFSGAKLAYFDYNDDKLDKLSDALKSKAIAKALEEFRNRIGNICDYLSRSELTTIGEDINGKIDKVKALVIDARNHILEGDIEIDYAEKLFKQLKAVKDEYIDIYIKRHNLARLTIKDDGKIEQLHRSEKYKALRMLSTIPGIFQIDKLKEIEDEFGALRPCTENVVQLLENNHICLCKYVITDKVGNARDKIDDIGYKIEKLFETWSAQLIKSIADPIIAKDIELLKPEEQPAIKSIISSNKLPPVIDQYFINLICKLFKGFESVILQMDDLMASIQDKGAMTIDEIKSAFSKRIDDIVMNKDKEKVRIILQK